MLCCAGRCTEPHLLLLSGTDLAGVVHGLTKTNTPVFSPQMEYLPGESVPLSTSTPSGAERMKAVVGRAMEASLQGTPVVLACDAWGNQNAIVSAGLTSGLDAPASSALLHTPLAAVVAQAQSVEKLNRALTDFGVLYKGTPAKTAGSLHFLTPNHVNAAAAALKRLPSESGEHAPSDMETLAGILRRHLLTSLSLDVNPAGVHVEPRAQYDHVVQAHRRPERSAARVAALHPPRAGPSVLASPPQGRVLNVSYPRFCDGCMKPEAAEGDGHVACGKCMGHVRDILAKQ